MFICIYLCIYTCVYVYMHVRMWMGVCMFTHRILEIGTQRVAKQYVMFLQYTGVYARSNCLPDEEKGPAGLFSIQLLSEGCMAGRPQREMQQPRFESEVRAA